MSQENVEIVRSAFQALDAGGIEAAVAFLRVDVVWYTTDRWLEGAAYRGHDGMRELVSAFSENFDDWGHDVHELRDAGDRVVALVDQTGRIKNSGAPVSQRLGLVVSGFDGGKLGEVRVFAGWADALEAVGLAE